MQNFKRGEGLSLRARAGMVLASILAAGAIAPAVRQAEQQAVGQRAVAVDPANLRESKNDKAMPAQSPAPSGDSIALSMGNDSTTYLRPKYGPCPPHVWGQSAACARLVRHNRLRALGLGGARI